VADQNADSETEAQAIMEKFVPFEKLSKKKKHKHNTQKRRDWGAVNPVTRVPPNPKAYDRNREKAARQDSTDDF